MVDHTAIEQWTEKNWLEVVLSSISTPSVKEAITKFPPENLEEGLANPLAGVERHFAGLLRTRFLTLIVPSKIPGVPNDFEVKLTRQPYSGNLSLEIMWPINRTVKGEKALKSNPFDGIAYQALSNSDVVVTKDSPPSVGFQLTKDHPANFINDCNKILTALHSYTGTTLPLDTILLDPHEFQLEGRTR